MIFSKEPIQHDLEKLRLSVKLEGQAKFCVGLKTKIFDDPLALEKNSILLNTTGAMFINGQEYY